MNDRTLVGRDEILALTGIRALAAAWVVGFHFCGALSLLFPKVGGILTACFRSGRLGVDLFFLLSGFIIAYNYQDQLHPFRLTKYKEFLWARLARLYPVHLFTLLACLGLYWGANIVGAHLNTQETNWGAWDFAGNIFMVHAWTYHGHLNWNYPSWSISCEWLAYLCFPLLAAFVSLGWRRPVLWLFVILLLVGYLGLNLIEWSGLHWMFMGIAFEFPAGVCLCQLYRLDNSDSDPVRSPLQPIAVLALGAMMVAISIFNFTDIWLIPLLGFMLYAIATGPHGILSRLLACRFACYWGRVSYSLYMTHAITSMVMSRFLPLSSFQGRSLMIRLGACGFYFGCLAAAAALTYHTIEEPARRRMRHFFDGKRTS